MSNRSSFWLLSSLALWLLSSPSFAQSDMGTVVVTGLMRVMHMNSVLLPDLPMSRDGSGTSWMPDNSPMDAIHWGNLNWSYMLHGSISARDDNQDVANSGRRGGKKFDGPNWIMLAANHPFALHKQITLRGMWSLDPATEGKTGYPLLFQTGEGLIDRQHPHDFFSEMAVIYSQAFNTRSGFFAYVGYPGEPALGPSVYMHRPSAVNLLDAPLGHHWQDATHISFGVATLGLRYRAFKLDGSIFTGREPNELRWDFDKPRFDSYSARLSFNPTDRWSWQVSGGYLKSPEKTNPDINLYRATASAMYAVPIRDFNSFSLTAVWGMNKVANPEAATMNQDIGRQHSVLLESNLRLDPYDIFGRTEWVQKPADELGILSAAQKRFDIGVLTLGLDRDIYHYRKVKLMAGAQGSVFSVPDAIRSVYGQAPFSVEAFLRLSPRSMFM